MARNPETRKRAELFEQTGPEIQYIDRKDTTRINQMQATKYISVINVNDGAHVTQMQAVELFFIEEPKTCNQVANESGISPSFVIRYTFQLRKLGLLHFNKRDTCPITGLKAAFYCTLKGAL